LSAGERIASEETNAISSGLQDCEDKVEPGSSTSTDGGRTLTATGNLSDQQCRGSPGRSRNDADRQPSQGDMHLHMEAPLDQMTSPPVWTTSTDATGCADFRLDTATERPLEPEMTSHSEHDVNHIRVEMTSSSSACDDVFAAIPDNTVHNNDVMEDHTTAVVASAVRADMTSFTPSTDSSHNDVFCRLSGSSKSTRQFPLEQELSDSSSTQHVPYKSFLSVRKSASCFDLNSLADAPKVDSDNSNSPKFSTTSPTLQLHLGQKLAVICQQTESGTSFAIVNATSGAESPESTADAEKRFQARDFNDNSNVDDDRTTSFPQTESSWQRESFGEEESATITTEDYFGVDVTRISDDVIGQSANSSSSSRRHQRHLIFV